MAPLIGAKHIHFSEHVSRLQNYRIGFLEEIVQKISELPEGPSQQDFRETFAADLAAGLFLGLFPAVF
jgi:hypothetical protein